MKVWPAMESVAVRWLDVEFAATAYATVPLPLPLAPDVIVSQEALLEAVHEHPVTAVTATLPVDAAPLTETLVGEIDELHGEVNANVLDSVLRPIPVGPTATTLAS